MDGLRCEPFKVYRKVMPSKSAVSEAVADTDDVVFSEEATKEVVTGS